MDVLGRWRNFVTKRSRSPFHIKTKNKHYIFRKKIKYLGKVDRLKTLTGANGAIYEKNIFPIPIFVEVA